jgi:hypothetical protein
MSIEKLSGNRAALVGAVFGAWVFGWLMMADWLMYSGFLAQALHLDSKLITVSPLSGMLLSKSVKSAVAVTPHAWLTGPGGTLVATILCAILLWLFWLLAKATKLDKHALAVQSICWTMRASVSPPFLLLLLTYVLVGKALIELIPYFGWSYWSLSPLVIAVMFLVLPLQLWHESVVKDNKMGRWWILQLPSLSIVLTMFVVLALAFVLKAMLPTGSWGEAISYLLSIPLVMLCATVLLKRYRKWAEIKALVKILLKWEYLGPWLVQDVLLMGLFIFAIAPLLALGYLNLLAVPALKDALYMSVLPEPTWFKQFVEVSSLVSMYWWAGLVTILIPLYAWCLLAYGRLAHLQQAMLDIRVTANTEPT